MHPDALRARCASSPIEVKGNSWHETGLIVSLAYESAIAVLEHTVL
jgi:hypothetical protein